eukprot:COSAG02_NODE_662_length_18752_cov_10.146464_9_plen_389_part_00
MAVITPPKVVLLAAAACCLLLPTAAAAGGSSAAANASLRGCDTDCSCCGGTCKGGCGGGCCSGCGFCGGDHPPAAGDDGKPELCPLGCFEHYGWEGCTLDNSRPPGCEQCLYVNNERLTPNKNNPMLRQCEALCDAKGYQYYALEDGTACYCGRGTLLASKQLTDSECGACPDLPGSMCGNIGGSKMAMYALSAACPRGRSLGLLFSTVVLGSAVLYLAVGIALRHRRTGAKGLQVLPHREQWLQLHGLVMDGVQFTRATAAGRSGRGGGGGGYAKVGEAARGGGGAGVSSSSSSSPPRRVERTKKGKRSKEKTSKTKSKGGTTIDSSSRSSDRAPADAAPAAGGSSSAAAAAGGAGAGGDGGGGGGEAAAVGSTAAGSGGRWVHVPG